MQLLRDMRGVLIIAIAWACIWFVLYVINADVFPLAGASAGFIWLIVILIFRWIGAQVAQVRAKEEDESANHAPDQDNGQG